MVLPPASRAPRLAASMMPGPAARGHDEAMVLAGQRARPFGQQPRQLARVLVEARPLDRLARSVQFRLIVLVGVLHAAGAERAERARRPLAAVDPRRPEKHHRVLNLLFLEAAQRLEVLGEDAERPGLGALEKLRIQVGQRLLMHHRWHFTRCYDRAFLGRRARNRPSAASFERCRIWSDMKAYLSVLIAAIATLGVVGAQPQSAAAADAARSMPGRPSGS